MLFRAFSILVLALTVSAIPVRAERPIVDFHRLDAYFALFAGDSNVPWKPTTVRLDTYSSAPVQFSVYQVDPVDVLTAGSNARPRAISTRGRRPVASFNFAPPGGYQFQSNEIDVQLGAREGFFVVEARRGDVGEQVWINRSRVGLISKETPGGLVVYGTDLGTGRALARMRVQFVANNTFVASMTDAHGVTRWERSPRPVFALAQWGSSYAFLSLLPQAPLPSTIVGVRTDSAVVHAGETVRVVGFARSRAGSSLRPSGGNATVSLRSGAKVIAEQPVAARRSRRVQHVVRCAGRRDGRRIHRAGANRRRDRRSDRARRRQLQRLVARRGGTVRRFVRFAARRSAFHSFIARRCARARYRRAFAARVRRVRPRSDAVGHDRVAGSIGAHGWRRCDHRHDSASQRRTRIDLRRARRVGRSNGRHARRRADRACGNSVAARSRRADVGNAPRVRRVCKRGRERKTARGRDGHSALAHGATVAQQQLTLDS